MKALLKNVKGLNREVFIYDVQPCEVPTLRYLIENTNIHRGSKLYLSNWSDSRDYVVTRYDSRVEIKPIVNYQ